MRFVHVAGTNRRVIREIVTIGDPVLKQHAREVTLEELFSPAVQTLIDDMVATMRHSSGLGLAASQLGESLRICVIDTPLSVLINPVLTPIGDEQISTTEGCLSVPEMVGEVKRSATVRVQATDRKGNTIDTIWTKQRAVVAQHEVDHLNGILYIERAHYKTDIETRAAQPPLVAFPNGNSEPGQKQTLVIQSPGAVAGTQYVAWTFSRRGKVTGVRLQPGGAKVTALWLSGVRLRARNFPAGALERFLIGDHPLHVAAGDMLRVELLIPSGKKRSIVAEADVDWA